MTTHQYLLTNQLLPQSQSHSPFSPPIQSTKKKSITSLTFSCSTINTTTQSSDTTSFQFSPLSSPDSPTSSTSPESINYNHNTNTNPNYNKHKRIIY